jgi:plastocyanin
VAIASINAFHIVGGLFALWAVTVTFLGLSREGFPRTRAQTYAVGAISLLLAAGSITSAVVVGILESDEHESEAAPPPSGGAGERLSLSADSGGQLRFDKKSLSARPGTVTVAMRNPSQIEHDVAIEGGGVDEKGKVVKGGDTSAVRASLKPGTYTFYCSVDQHRQAGMRGTLTVK